MKKVEEYLQDSYKWAEVEMQSCGVVYWQDLFRKYIKIAQEDAIRETVKECAENAKTKSFKLSKYNENPRWKLVKKEEEVDLFSYDFKTEVNKQSILSVADKLIKEL